MKAQCRRFQTIEGSISREELLALVRGTLNIPDHAIASFHLQGSYSSQQLVNMGGGVLPDTKVYVTEDSPVRFRITWDTDAQKQG